MELEESSKEFSPGEDTISLNAPSFGAPEVLEALESMLSTWVTMGEKVAKFEDLFANYLNASGGVMVNSGSSANLVALKALRNSNERPSLVKGDEVIVPACTWSTSVAPILDIGCKPILVDSDETFNLDPAAVKEAITSDTKAIMAVHLLGNPADIRSLREICDDHNLILFEDCCEAHGATLDGQKVGTFGEYGTYSFFFAHHISTIEGGMVVSSDRNRVEEVKPVRAHGWIREMEESEEIAAKHPEFDERFLFLESGLNVRPTEIQGAFGIHQMDRLEEFVEQRRTNAHKLTDALAPHDDVFRFQTEQDGGRHTYYGYPLVIREEAPFTRAEFTAYLEEHGIETRPIMGGNLAEHPAFNHLKDYAGPLEMANTIHKQGVFFGNHHQMHGEHTDFIVNTIEDFLAEETRS
ncbi:DegT/DnrJ/EryC1/StrS family aminotransferase [Halobellus sp. EA9]|uniref:DegT/DnrJ/EryC1/StrS family aminotransferase n=1 Tax=Halobellus sp. EA9 TaxID=3421647 RepID=UPI003EBB6126